MSTRPNYARRRALVLVLIALILIIGVGVPVALLEPVPEASASIVATPSIDTAAAHPVLPRFGSAAVGVVGMPGVLATSGNQSPRPIASITKVITALVVLEKKPLAANEAGPTITFTSADVAILQRVIADDGSWEPVQAGWQLTEIQAFQTMLIPSANNYAESLAIWAYGSVPKYLAAAHIYLKKPGMTHTSLVDTNGLGAGDTSTPTDLVQLGRLALAAPAIAATVRMASATEPQVGTFDNTNDLLGISGIDGIKTGTTTPAGACLLFTAPERVGTKTVQLVGVILNATTHAELDPAVVPLLASVRAGLHEVQLSHAKQVLAEYHTAWGGTAKAIATADSSTLVWSKHAIGVSANVVPIRGGTKGTKVGTVTYDVAGQRTSVPLVLDRSVLIAPVWWRLTHPFR